MYDVRVTEHKQNCAQIGIWREMSSYFMNIRNESKWYGISFFLRMVNSMYDVHSLYFAMTFDMRWMVSLKIELAYNYAEKIEWRMEKKAFDCRWTSNWTFFMQNVDGIPVYLPTYYTICLPRILSAVLFSLKIRYHVLWMSYSSSRR